MKIVIVGAGIAGLTLAVSLKKKSLSNVQIEIYERDESAFSRPQGYAIALSETTGISVFEKLDLKEKLLFQNCVKVSNFVINKQNGEILFSTVNIPIADQDPVYRVQRNHIIHVLMEELENIPIYYNANATGYEFHEAGVRVIFANGKQVDADYLIACDGVSSAIRQQMIGDQKQYLGLTSIFGLTKSVINHPLLDGGYFMTLGNNGSSFFSYPQPNGIYFSYTIPSGDERVLINKTKEQLIKCLQAETKDWHDLIREIILCVKTDTIGVRNYYDKEPLSTVCQKSLVWLIGDAAHPMCPFRGKGANMALIDAFELANVFEAISKNESFAKEKMEFLKGDIVKRGKEAVLSSRKAAKEFHEKNNYKRFS